MSEEYLNPYSPSTRWLRGNLHHHTCCSGFMDISESGPMFARLGYDFIAVSDHNMAPDEEQWRRWQDQAGLILIPGEENGDSGHILEIGTHVVSAPPDDSFAARARALRGGGGFIVACHPQQYPVDGADNIRAAAADLHAIEIFNGLREAIGCDEPANIALWDELLTAGNRLWGAANDDFHFALISPGHGWNCVQVPEEDETITWETIVRQLQAGAFYASTHLRFEQILLEDGVLSVTGGPRVRELLVIGSGGEVLHEAAGQALEWPVPSGLPYFRVEARAGVKRAWSQPFYNAG